MTVPSSFHMRIGIWFSRALIIFLPFCKNCVTFLHNNVEKPQDGCGNSNLAAFFIGILNRKIAAGEGVIGFFHSAKTASHFSIQIWRNLEDGCGNSNLAAFFIGTLNRKIAAGESYGFPGLDCELADSVLLLVTQSWSFGWVVMCFVDYYQVH